MRLLCQSIEQQGLQQPIIVRPVTNDKYEILAGHNRVTAFRINGQGTIPAIVVEADDDQAAMIVTETNLRQLQKLLPSEKAFAYKLQLDAIKHQGKKRHENGNDSSSENGLVACVQIEHKQKSRDLVAGNNDVDANEIRRYIRLTYLLPDLLHLVDEGGLQPICRARRFHPTSGQRILR